MKRRTPVGLVSSTTPEKTKIITESKVPTQEVKETIKDQIIEPTPSTPLWETENIGTINEEEIYAEYVALVDETHAEKEKQWEEEKERELNPTNTLVTDEIVDKTLQDTQEAIVTKDIESTLQEEIIPENYFDNIPWDIQEWEENHVEKDSIETIQESHITETTAIESEELKTELIQETENQEASKEMEEVAIQESEKEISETSLDTASTQEESDNKIENIPPEVIDTREKIQSPPEVPHNWEVKSPATVPAQTIPQPPKNHSETIFGLINTIRTVMARGQLVEARALIIQWLALDKNHRELNLMLGSLYEWERHFEKAEYVYKDLAIDHSDDVEILEKLGNVLIIEKRYAIAMEIYKKILWLGWETEGTLYILAHLCHELNDADEGYHYMKKYLKSWPNNPEILALMSEVEIELNKRKDAIETLKRLKNLTPYNSEITATLQKLMMEEELAGNFGDNH